MFGFKFAAGMQDDITFGAAGFNGSGNLVAPSFTGQQDGNFLFFSTWFFLNSGTTGLHDLVSISGSEGFWISLDADTDQIVVSIGFAGSPGNRSISARTTTTFTKNAWHHLFVGIDLTNTANRGIYIDDVEASVTWSTYTGSLKLTPDGGSNNWYLAGDSNLNGSIAEPFFKVDASVNVNNQLIRRNFISSSGSPVVLGADGIYPFGVKPLFYNSIQDDDAQSAFLTNRAGNGNWSGSVAAGVLPVLL